jgi:hypothetical protein
MRLSDIEVKCPIECHNSWLAKEEIVLTLYKDNMGLESFGIHYMDPCRTCQVDWGGFESVAYLREATRVQKGSTHLVG